MPLRPILLALTLAFAIPAAAQTPVPTPARPPVGQGADGDWGFLARYRAANVALPPTNPARVVFMGDSITELWSLQPFMKGDPSHVDRGVSGQTTPQMLVRFRADVIALKPAVVHLMAGTNDVAGNTGPETDTEIEGYIASMVELAQAEGAAVVLASIPPAGDFKWRPGLNPGPRIMALNAWLKAYAAERHAVYVDYWSALATPDGGMNPAYSPDGVHPNPAGFAVMQPLAEAAIAQALKTRR